MLLLSTPTSPGERLISVRGDDLSEQERTLVRETLRLIKRMDFHNGLPLLMYQVIAILGALGMMLGMLHDIPNVSFPQFLAIAMTGGAVAGILGWIITRPIVNRRHDSDALLLTNLSRHARCGDLIREYSAANPWFAQTIKRRITQAVTAQ